MNNARWIKTIDYLLLAISTVCLLLLLYAAFIGLPFSIDYIPIVLIISYVGLNGVRLMLKGSMRLGLYLLLFAVMMALVNIIIKVAFKLIV